MSYLFYMVVFICSINAEEQTSFDQVSSLELPVPALSGGRWEALQTRSVRCGVGTEKIAENLKNVTYLHISIKHNKTFTIEGDGTSVNVSSNINPFKKFTAAKNWTSICRNAESVEPFQWFNYTIIYVSTLVIYNDFNALLRQPAKPFNINLLKIMSSEENIQWKLHNYTVIIGNKSDITTISQRCNETLIYWCLHSEKKYENADAKQWFKIKDFSNVTRSEKIVFNFGDKSASECVTEIKVGADEINEPDVTTTNERDSTSATVPIEPSTIGTDAKNKPTTTATNQNTISTMKPSIPGTAKQNTPKTVTISEMKNPIKTNVNLEKSTTKIIITETGKNKETNVYEDAKDKEATTPSYYFLLFLIIPLIVAIMVIYTMKRKNHLLEPEDEIPLQKITFANEDKRIKREDFECYIRRLAERNEMSKIDDIFENLATPESQCKEAKTTKNKIKNRYMNVIPNDSHRVKLDSSEDYINATFVEGHRGAETYIATQCPKLNTIKDFWHMVWQENCSIIVMLASIAEKTKVNTYWPNKNVATVYRDIDVETVEERHHADYVLRHFVLTKGCEKKSVLHFNYLSWPDNAVPLFPLSFLEFMKIIEGVDEEKGPIIVHCSAGIGRTGTYIVCDFFLRAQPQFIDIAAHLRFVRQCHPMLIATSVQFRFVHYIVNEIIQGNAEHDELIDQMSLIEDKSYADKILHSFSRRPDDVDESGIEESQSFVFLPPLPDRPNSSFVNAVFIDGLQRQKKFIATQLPARDAQLSFWRLVENEKVTQIMLPQSMKFWPEKEQTFENLKVTVFNKLNCEFYKRYEMELKNLKSRDWSHVELIVFDGWTCGEALPGVIDEFYYFCRMVSEDSEGPILLCCVDGTIGCGLFTACDFLLAKLVSEDVADPTTAVRSIRKFNPNFIKTSEQYSFLIDFCEHYVKHKAHEDHEYVNVAAASSGSRELMYQNVFGQT